MKKTLRILLNAPWSLVGLLLAATLIPKRVYLHKDPPALVFETWTTWWGLPLSKSPRAIAEANVVILSPRVEENDLAHELIHVEQSMRYPFLFRFMYVMETIRNGNSPKNKYEQEAYTRSNSVYRGGK